MSVKKNIQRFDRGELAKPVRQPNGWLLAEGYISRTGIQIYYRADGSEIREYRPPEEVQHADSLGSFALVPLTNNHPPGGKLDASNTKLYQVGTVDHPEAAGERVRARVLITDENTVTAAESGKVELSCGYVCDLEETAGEINGERYDAIQRNIRGNHVALVSAGRAGPTVRLRMDSSDAEVVASDSQPIHGDSSMKKCPKCGKEVSADAAKCPECGAAMKSDATSEVARMKAEADQLVKLIARADAAEAATEKEKARADALAAELEKVKAELAASPAKIKAEIAARVALEGQARKVFGVEAKFDGKDDLTVRREVAEKVNGVKLDGKSEAYVSAAFDIAIAKVDAEPGTLGEKAAKTTPIENVDGADMVAQARAKYAEALSNAYKGAK